MSAVGSSDGFLRLSCSLSIHFEGYQKRKKSTAAILLNSIGQLPSQWSDSKLPEICELHLQPQGCLLDAQPSSQRTEAGMNRRGQDGL